MLRLKTFRDALMVASFAAMSSVSSGAELVTEKDIEKLVIIGRLNAIENPPDCGTVHFGALAEYSNLTVLEGDYGYPTIQVIHGCVELSRKDYGPDRGDLSEFHLGKFHRMVLVNAATFEGTLFSGTEPKETPRFFCEHVTSA